MKKIIISLFLLSLILTQCKKEDNPEYVGEWSATYPTNALDGNDTILVEGKDTYVFGKSSYTLSSYIKYDQVFIQSYEEKGNLSVSNGVFTFIVNQYGFSTLNQNNHVTGAIIPIDISSESEENRSYSKPYTLNPGELTIYYGDYNEDGDMNDYLYGEYITFFRTN